MTPAQVAHIMALVDEYLYAPLKQKRAAIEAALRDAPQAEGWVMVPVEPDETMEAVGDMNLSCGAPDVYRAMLAARPSAPTAVEHKPLFAEMIAQHPGLREELQAESTALEPPYPMATTIEGAAQDVAKWLNERPNSPLDLRHVAMLVHAVQAAAAVGPDERQDFEWAYRAKYPVSCDLDPAKFNRSDEGDYEDIRVSIAWAMWQARASKGTPL